MKIKKYIIGLVLSLSMMISSNSCNFLEANEFLNEVENLNDIWTERYSIRKSWAACYSDIPNFSGSTGDWLFHANYDEGHAGLNVYNSFKFARGQYSADTPLMNHWSKYYKAIRICCNFLENSHLATDRLLKEGEVDGYNADARFLRAYYYSLLMEMYGPFTIIKNTIDYDKPDTYITARSPLDECVAFLVEEFDMCIEALPKNSLISNDDAGRPSKEAAMALKARVLLWAASPLVNGNTKYASFTTPEGVPFFNVGAVDVEKWKVAAKAYKDVIDLNEFELFTVEANDGYITVPLGDFEGNDVQWPNGPAGIDPYRSYKALFSGGNDYWNDEVIWQVYNPGQTSALTRWGMPKSYNNAQAHASSGELCATQKMVDQYFLNNGKRIENDAALYQDHSFSDVGDDFFINGDGLVEEEDERPSPIHTGFNLGNEYPRVPSRILNREARFYANIGFTGRGYVSNVNGVPYFSNFQNGMPDGYIETDRPSSRSGYPITKWVNDTETSAFGSVDKPYHVIRLAEVYLAYAEALNEYDPTNDDITKYLNMVRFRAGLPGYEIGTKDVNRARIKAERYVELAFESKRYFDSRRWMDAEIRNSDVYGNVYGMHGPVWGCDYLKTDSDFFNRTIIDGYLFRDRNYFLPIPYTEVANHWGELVQNPGW